MAAAFFDLDKTICSISSEKAFAKFLLTKGYLSISKVLKIIWTYLLYDLNIIRNYEECKRALLHSVIAGKSVEELDLLLEEFFTIHLKPSIYPELAAIIKEHRVKNRFVVIISASIDLISKRVAEYLDIPYLYATNLEIVNGIYTGSVVGDIHYGETKAEAVSQFCYTHSVDPESCYAYGDHGMDQFMLNCVGKAVAVNPDNSLTRIANRNRWQIIKAEL